jgi:hypothetical protein
MSRAIARRRKFSTARVNPLNRNPLWTIGAGVLAVSAVQGFGSDALRSSMRNLSTPMYLGAATSGALILGNYDEDWATLVGGTLLLGGLYGAVWAPRERERIRSLPRA